MSTRVLFIQPPYRTHVVSPPMGLGYLCSHLRDKGHQVSLLDINLTHLSRQGISEFVREYKPDAIGISVMCTGIDPVRSIVDVVRSASDVPVIIGGAQVSALPEHTLRYSGADFAVVGEGEQTMAELLSALEDGDSLEPVRGLAYLIDNVFQQNQPRPLIEDLDSLPFPAWDLMPPGKYRIAPILSSAKRFPIAPVVTSRGCPFDCTFCAGKSIWGRTHRFRAAEAVVDEIEMLMKEYGVREVFIGDDNFNLKTSHAAGVCEEILNRRLKIHWACPNGLRVDSLTPELLGLMKRAGCHLVGLGIESASQEILDRAKKALDLSKVRSVCDDIKRAGITAVGFFVLGLPGETKESIMETIEFAKSLPLKRAWFNILAPYPGSELFDIYVARENLDLDKVDWSTFDTSGKQVARMSSVGPEALDRLQKKAAWSFYARPRILVDLAISQRPSTIAAFLRSQFFHNILVKERDEGSIR